MLNDAFEGKRPVGFCLFGLLEGGGKEKKNEGTRDETHPFLFVSLKLNQRRRRFDRISLFSRAGILNLFDFR